MSKSIQHSHSAASENTPLLSAKDDMSKKISEESNQARNKLIKASIFCLVFMIAEIIGGYIANSLAVMTDAAHLLSDVAGFLISIFAIWVSSLPATDRLSYGFHRAEILGALVSVLVIWFMAGLLVYEAVLRCIDILGPDPKEHVNGKIMFIVAALGMVINIILMSILGHGHSHDGGHDNHGHSHGSEDKHSHSHGSAGQNAKHSNVKHGNKKSDKVGKKEKKAGHGHGHGHGHGSSEEKKHHHDLEAGHNSLDEEKDTPIQRVKKTVNLNVQAAYIHALGDLLQSVGVCIAGALIWYNPKWQLADPIATFLFSIVVLFSTAGIVKKSTHVLMEGVPDGINPEHIKEGLKALDSVIDVHHIHVWSLTLGKAALSVHIVSNEPEKSLHDAQDFLERNGLTHTTIQVERPDVNYVSCHEGHC